MLLKYGYFPVYYDIRIYEFSWIYVCTYVYTFSIYVYIMYKEFYRVTESLCKISSPLW